MINPKAYTGKRIAPFSKGDVLRRSRLNELVNCLNALLNPIIRHGDSDAAFISEANAVYQVRDLTGTGTGSGNMNFRGKWQTGVAYDVNDVVYTQSLDGATRTPWIALEDSTSIEPVWPEPESTVYWRCLAHFPTGGWRGEWDSGTTYAAGDMVRVSSNPASPAEGSNYTGVWVSATDSNTGHQPIYPEPISPATCYWFLISLGPREINVTDSVVGKKAYFGASDPFTPP